MLPLLLFLPHGTGLEISVPYTITEATCTSTDESNFSIDLTIYEFTLQLLFTRDNYHARNVSPIGLVEQVLVRVKENRAVFQTQLLAWFAVIQPHTNQITTRPTATARNLQGSVDVPWLPHLAGSLLAHQAGTHKRRCGLHPRALPPLSQLLEGYYRS
jgi:hypothetical protein